MAEKVTITDIARLAGVSKATVSRVINQKPDVDPETRERVLRVMADAAFTPSITAAGLAGRSRLLGVLVPSLTWPFMGEIMRGVAELVEHTSYELVLYCITPTHDRFDIFRRILETKLTSGLLAVLPGDLTEHLSALHAQGFPVVMIDDQGHPTSTPWIGADNHQGAFDATRHLLRLGHRRIGFIQGPERYECSQQRYAGYAQALAEAGLAPDATLLLHGNFEVDGGELCGERFLAMAERPTAVFASNDDMAYGVLDVAERHGVRVPEDLAVIGFDDIPLSARWRPPLTTVRQPFFEMGQRGLEQLLALVESEPGERARRGAPSPAAAVETPPRLRLATRLIIRDSCGASLPLTSLS